MTAVAASLVSAAAAPAHAGPFIAQVTPVALTAPTQMVDANGTLVVLDGDSVVLLDEAGSVLSTLSGFTGAAHLVLSEDRVTAYVVRSSTDEIVAIDVPSKAVGATYAIGHCADQLARVGSMLFYTYGCVGATNVGHVDLQSGAVKEPGTPDAQVDLDTQLSGGTTTLFALGSSEHVRAWTATAAGLSGERTSAAAYDMAVVLAIGDRVLVRPYGYSDVMLDVDLQETARTWKVALGPAPVVTRDGTRILSGSDAGDRTVEVREVETGGLVVGPFGLAPAGQGNDVEPLPLGLSFSADESHVLVLARDMWAPGYALMTSIAGTPSNTTLVVSVRNPSRLGLPVAVSIVTTGRPGTPVRLTFQPSAGKIVTKAAVTDATGYVRVLFTSSYSGGVQVYAAGDATHYDATSTVRRWSVPSRMTVYTSSGYTARNGIRYFHKATDARFVVVLAPGVSGREVIATLQIRVSGRWARVQSLVVVTRSNGTLGFYLLRARTGYAYRVLFSFRGDRWNTGSSGASAAFVVG
ncbi:MAG TPA: hypothetical protein VFL59_00585 [Candidatus Nanopelagicales bacterium]|nr:hypothetical protein [Candidatus Nanopelagicales bacterium]